ncbi:MAG: Phospholipase D precursor [bacterium ADurb.Bin243]|nr:MAG: Phospholipase D precursor [bacterium ADurb.Bin243]
MRFNFSNRLPLLQFLFLTLLLAFILMPFHSYAAKTDKIKIFFNDPPDTKNIDIELANFIDSASKSVIAHFYQINRQCVIDAFVRAAKKLGPKNVKIITESKYYKNKKFVPFYAQLEAAGISILTDESDGSKGSGESHNKFCVVDSARVWTGSYNATDNNTVKDHNNALILDSTDAANIYTEEFSMMYDRLLFGSRKEPTRAKHKFSIDSVEVEIYFSPADNVNGIIENYIRKASAAVSFVIFAFTEDNIEDALISRHKAGVNVRGMCDDLSAGGKSSGYYTLLSNNMNIKKDSNPRAQLHHKFTVIDHESGTSAVVITGSHNYTKAANTKNDENIVIIHDRYYAQLYFNEFAKLYGAPMIKIAEPALSINQGLKQSSTAEVQLNKPGTIPASGKTTENIIK